MTLNFSIYHLSEQHVPQLNLETLEAFSTLGEP